MTQSSTPKTDPKTDPKTGPATGATNLIRTLVDSGIDHCFANPGTSEMSLVQAIDQNVQMRPVLCLFEGVCTGAADGFARAAGRPASTLLHLGPGLANGIANLHNARRAATPLLNLIGDHATYHKPFDTPLTSDIETLARPFSRWVRTVSSADGLGQDAAEGIRVAQTRHPGTGGQVATLIIPADCAWGESSAVASGWQPEKPPEVAEATIKKVAEQINERSLLLLGGDALTPSGLRSAASIAQATGCRYCCVTFPARVELGPQLPHLPRMPYFPEHIQEFFGQTEKLILAGSEEPISFFAYRNKSSVLTPATTEIYRLSHQHENSALALAAVAEHIDAPAVKTQKQKRPPLPQGGLSARAISQSVAAQIPDHSILCADSGGGGATFDPVQSAAPVMWLNLTGGSIGQGGPTATGAALACPDRPVVALLGDGGAMYTIQCLWTQARENLNVTNIIFNNASYQILVTEYLRMGVNEVGARAGSLFDLGQPTIDWVSLAGGMGVPGIKAQSAEEFNDALAKSLATPGPMLIDAVLSQ